MDKMEKIVALAKRRGFVYPTSEIYGGLSNSYDYGPMGAELIRNIRNLWWKEFIHKRVDMVGLDSQIILHPETWVASGHVGAFSDPLVEDVKTHKRYRADHLIEVYYDAINEAYRKISDAVEYNSNVDIFNREQFSEHVLRATTLDGQRYENNILKKGFDHIWINLLFKSYHELTPDNTYFEAAYRVIFDELKFHYENKDGSSDYWRTILKHIDREVDFEEKAYVVLLYFIVRCLSVENMSIDDMADFIKLGQLVSPDGNALTPPKAFNLLFETEIGSVSGEKSKVYLRGETAQGIFTNFKQVVDSTRVQLPFGIGQIGKSFRNEITTGQFIFRTLEFEQAEIEYFFDPETDNWEKLLSDWKECMKSFIEDVIGIKAENLRWRRHTDKERSHYSTDTYDLDYNFPFGWKELWGVAYRTNYDLNQHAKHANVSLDYTDSQTGRKFTPHVIEPAVGINRIFLMCLADAYHEEGDRVVLKLSPKLAPYVACVSPLLANKEELKSKAQSIFGELANDFRVAWDARGNIGKRYAAQDEIGTPFCITIDFETLENNTVTVRDRDTGEQERVEASTLKDFLLQKLA